MRVLDSIKAIYRPWVLLRKCINTKVFYNIERIHNIILYILKIIFLL
jgi:hypothetical protein